MLNNNVNLYYSHIYRVVENVVQPSFGMVLYITCKYTLGVWMDVYFDSQLHMNNILTYIYNVCHTNPILHQNNFNFMWRLLREFLGIEVGLCVPLQIYYRSAICIIYGTAVFDLNGFLSLDVWRQCSRDTKIFLVQISSFWS